MKSAGFVQRLPCGRSIGRHADRMAWALMDPLPQRHRCRGRVDVPVQAQRRQRVDAGAHEQANRRSWAFLPAHVEGSDGGPAKNRGEVRICQQRSSPFCTSSATRLRLWFCDPPWAFLQQRLQRHCCEPDDKRMDCAGPSSRHRRKHRQDGCRVPMDHPRQARGHIHSRWPQGADPFSVSLSLGLRLPRLAQGAV